MWKNKSAKRHRAKKMGAGLSVDNSKTISDTINETTRKFVAETNLDCANDLKQLSEFEVREGADVDIGGDLIVAQKAALVNKCAQQVSNKQEMFAEIANAVAQKVDQEKGSDKMFQLVGVTNAEQTTNIKNALNDEYKAITGVKCDTSLNQVQKVVLAGKIKVGGKASFTQDAALSAGCKQMADLARKVADKVKTEVTQTTVQSLPVSPLVILIGGVILLVVLGMIGSYLFATKTETGRDMTARGMAMLRGQQQYQAAAMQQQQQRQQQLLAQQQQLRAPVMTPAALRIPQANPQAVSAGVYRPPSSGFTSF